MAKGASPSCHETQCISDLTKPPDDGEKTALLRNLLRTGIPGSQSPFIVFVIVTWTFILLPTVAGMFADVVFRASSADPACDCVVVTRSAVLSTVSLAASQIKHLQLMIQTGFL